MVLHNHQTNGHLLFEAWKSNGLPSEEFLRLFLASTHLEDHFLETNMSEFVVHGNVHHS